MANTTNTANRCGKAVEQYAKAKKAHICAAFPLMRGDVKAEICARIDESVSRMYSGLITVDEAARLISEV